MDGGKTEGPDKGEGDSEMPRSGLEHVEADVAAEVVPVPAPHDERSDSNDSRRSRATKARRVAMNVTRTEGRECEVKKRERKRNKRGREARIALTDIKCSAELLVRASFSPREPSCLRR